MAHGRVPLLPSAMTSAGSAVATSAPAIDAFWPSMPMESVRDGCRVDLRARACCDMRRHWLWEAHPRDVGGQPPAIGSHYVSAYRKTGGDPQWSQSNNGLCNAQPAIVFSQLKLLLVPIVIIP